MTEFKYFGKVAVVGSSGVGKTSICQSFIGNKINGVELTIAAAFFRYHRCIENERIQIDVWDTAGTDRFSENMKNFYRGSCIVLLVYDITNKESFRGLDKWIKRVVEEVPKDLSIFLVGNKLDLGHLRRVTYKEGEAYARKMNQKFFETSALTGENIYNVFDDIANRIYDIATGKYYMDIDSPILLTIIGKNPIPQRKQKKNSICLDSCVVL